MEFFVCKHCTFAILSVAYLFSKCHGLSQARLGFQDILLSYGMFVAILLLKAMQDSVWYSTDNKDILKACIAA